MVRESGAKEVVVTLSYEPGGEGPGSVEVLVDGVRGGITPAEHGQAFNMNTSHCMDEFARDVPNLLALTRWGHKRAPAD